MALYGLSRNQWRQIIAALAGWLMDGYTSIAYALMAYILAPIFFPATMPEYLKLVFVFAGYAVGGAARPIGSLIFGNYIGDRLGRKTMLVVTIIGFSISAASLGLLPTFKQASFFAPLLLYVVLFIEGMFAGAEYGGGTALSMESIPAERRNFIGAFVQSGFGMGFALIALTSLAFSYFLGDTQMAVYGWRLVFFTTIIPGLIALVIRRGAEETKVFEKMEREEKVERVPVFSMLREAPYPIIIGFIMVSGLLYVNSATFNFYPTVMLQFGKTDFSTFAVVLTINLMSLAGVLSGGAIASKIGGRKKPMLIFAIIFIATIYPLITLGISQSYFYVYATIFFGIQSVLEAMVFATIPALLAESFSKRYRATAVSFTYNMGGVAAGFALLAIELGVPVFGLKNSWLINLFGASIIMIIGIILIKETWVKGAEGRDLINE